MKKFLMLLLSVLLFTNVFASKKHLVKHAPMHKHHTTKKKYSSAHPHQKPSDFLVSDTTSFSPDTSVNHLLKVLVHELGKPYKYGSNGPTGYDCSGLMKFAFSFIGQTLPRTASEIGQLGEAISMDDLQPGDLLFFSGRRNSKTKSIGHVGCVYKVDSGKIYMIHSSDQGTNILDITKSEYYNKRLISARRIIEDKSCSLSPGKAQ